MNCPECHLECDDLCSYHRDSKCHSPYWGEPESIYDLMSHEELIEEVQKSVKQDEWNRKQWDMVRQLKAQILHLQNKLMVMESKI